MLILDQLKKRGRSLANRCFLCGEEDMLRMKNVKDGRFSVKHFYLLLTTGQESLFLYRFVWNSWVPTKVGFFTWEAS